VSADYSDARGKKYAYHRRSNGRRTWPLVAWPAAERAYRDLLAAGASPRNIARGHPFPFDYRQHFVVSFTCGTGACCTFSICAPSSNAQLEIRTALRT